MQRPRYAGMSQHNSTSDSEKQQSSSRNPPENKTKKLLLDLPKSEIDNFFTKLTASQKQELVRLSAEECHTRMQLLYEQHEENLRLIKLRNEMLDDKNINNNKKSEVTIKKTKFGLSRLQKEYLELKNSPIPNILAEPDPENMFIWHYLLIGPEDTPYKGGIYHGIVNFPKEYPFKPPMIKMLTPNGRFVPNKFICMSNTAYHSENWNPAWSVSSFLVGFLSFMTSNCRGGGKMVSSDVERKNLAKQSYDWNMKLKKRGVEGQKFYELFHEFIEKHEEERRSQSKNSE